MPDETSQPNPEPAQPQPSSEAPAGNVEPTPTPLPENQNFEPTPAPVSPQESIPDAPTPPTDSVPAETPSGPTETSPNPDDAVLDKDQNPANEPFESAPVPENVPTPDNPNTTIEKNGNDVTITEVMEPTAHSEPATAQMAGNEPLNSESDQAKIRKENLIKANEKRQSKKREKIDEILNLFSKEKEITNDEVEKLLHVSDATATRYLETLEKEGKIKQIGKTGKGVRYEKI